MKYGNMALAINIIISNKYNILKIKYKKYDNYIKYFTL